MNQVLPEGGYALMLVTDRTRSRVTLPELVRRAVDGGVDAIQVREKDLSEAELRDVTAEVIAAAQGEAWVVVNGNLAVARELQIGVHLPENGPTIEQARAKLGDSAIIGRSVHSVHEAANSHGANYLIAGPVQPTKSKPGAKLMPLETLEAIENVSNCPVFAIGGITSGTIRSTMGLGAHGVAVIGAICDADDPSAAAAALRKALDDHAEEHLG